MAARPITDYRSNIIQEEEKMKRALFILAGLFIIPLYVMAQALPTMPPAGYDQGGLYPAGTVNTITYYSSVYGTNEQMMVYTPPGYSTSQRYPVIYGYQGISAGIGTIFDTWCVGAGVVADNLIGQGIIKPVIIVAVNDQINGDPTADTINCAIPYIDSHYSTYADADHRGLYGYSWGGMYCADIGCANLNTFYHISPSSPAFFSSGQGPGLFPNGGAQAKQVLKCLLLSCGTADWDGFYPPSQDLHNYCVSNNIPHGWLPVLGEGHDGGVWRPAMWNFLQMADAAGFRYPPRPRSAYSQVTAVSYDIQVGGVVPETCSDGGQDVGTIQNGNYLVFNNIDFGVGAVSFNARVASATSGGNIEIHLDSTNGTLVGTCAVPGPGGWQTWVTQSCSVSGAAGIHNLYLKFTGGSGYLFNVEWWKFNTSSWPVPPLAPGGLVATAGIERAALRWTASSNATSYNVKRATTNGGPYSTVANVAGTNYTDRGVIGGATVIGGTTYYYVVSALNLGGESTNSSQASVTPTVNVPSPWLAQDIGAGGLAGGASFTNGVLTVIGCGADIWDPSDEFRFVNVTNSGNCTIIARVVSVQNIDGWSKAGVMIRDSLDPGAANAFIAVTPGNGVTWQYRSSDGGGCNNNTTGGSAPYWVKLVCSGSTFTGYCSPNGTNWTQLGSTTLTNVTSTAYIGLAVTAHNNSSLCTAKFDNVIAPGWPPPLLTVNAIATSSTQVSVTWNSLTNATSYNVKRSTTSGGPYAPIATSVTATNYTDTVASVRAGYYYVVSAMIGGSETTNSPEAAVRFLKLTGGIIGTSGSWGGSGNTITNVFDNNLNTFFDGPDASGDWVGLDFGVGVSNVITQINYCPRSGFESRMVGGIFQGANQANFSGAVTLCTVTTQPATGVFTSASITNTSAFRYVRYLSPANGYCNVSELEFYGYRWSNPVLPPTSLNALGVSASQINLGWNALTGATSYNVKRSLTNGGSYTTIASGVTATNYQDTGLAGGTIHYYVVSAIVSGSETTNSAQATATTLSPTVGSLVHRYSFSETGGVSVADSVGGPVWAGTLPSGGTLSGGQLVLSAGSQQYVSLPAGIVSSLSNCTVMAWVNLASASGWSRIFDFGNDTNTYIFLTPQNGSSGTVQFALTTGGGGAEQQINGNSTLSTGALHQLAVTLNSGTGILYVDGAAAGTNSGMTINPSSMGSTVNNYLGKSQYADPYLDGSLDEFRIYNVALSSAEIAATAALGSGQLLSTNSPPMSVALAGTSLTISWPLANAGFTLQSRTNLTLGNWEDVTSPAPQIIGGQLQVTLPRPDNLNTVFYQLSK
jgi:enterochelin esterase-like enzyme/fibronectin type 3 domain-containing protein